MDIVKTTIFFVIHAKITLILVEYYLISFNHTIEHSIFQVVPLEYPEENNPLQELQFTKLLKIKMYLQFNARSMDLDLMDS
jgi:hypothetical protein